MKKKFVCFKCNQELELCQNIYNNTIKCVRDHRLKLIQTLKGARKCVKTDKIIEELKETSGRYMRLECFDLSVKTRCYHKRAKELAQRQEDVEEVLTNKKRLTKIEPVMQLPKPTTENLNEHIVNF